MELLELIQIAHFDVSLKRSMIKSSLSQWMVNVSMLNGWRVKRYVQQGALQALFALKCQVCQCHRDLHSSLIGFLRLCQILSVLILRSVTWKKRYMSSQPHWRLLLQKQPTATTVLCSALLSLIFWLSAQDKRQASKRHASSDCSLKYLSPQDLILTKICTPQCHLVKVPQREKRL